jgi:antitoxin (DNA-binding transcriptional repressor) of toxin-antitoxin stability system
MEKATISELKNSLSAYLKKVRAGRSVIIFDRDQPVARLERIESTEGEDDAVARLERAGLVRRGRTPVPLALLKQQAPKAKRSVVKALTDERREGR